MAEQQVGADAWQSPTKESGVEKYARNLVERFLMRSPDKKSQSCSCKQMLGGSVSLLFAGLALGLAFWPHVPWYGRTLAFLGSLGLMGLGTVLFLSQLGAAVSYVLQKKDGSSNAQMGVSLLRGQLGIEEAKKGIPAPELALQQFVQQVRSYATEKSFQRGRLERSEEPRPGMPDTSDLIFRRWNEVVDSLNEFEIYLANDPNGMIEKLISRSPAQTMDVSRIFREVSETFDNTWRRKGINIESAIVTPLKATTNEAVLRRLLVGPWRACVHFARRGGGVVFSARSVSGRVIALWECEGLVIPENYLAVAQDSSLSVNERIEKGMEAIGPDPMSPNTFHGLISFVTWIDLARALKADYSFKHTGDGFVIELRLT